MEDFTQRIASIRDDREHGSRWLVRQTILLLRDLASENGPTAQQRLERTRQAGRELAQARPAMAALAGAVVRILAASDNADGMARAAAGTRLCRRQQQTLCLEHAAHALRQFDDFAHFSCTPRWLS